MNKQADPVPPHLTGDQIRQILAAEKSGENPDCFLCGSPVNSVGAAVHYGMEEETRVVTLYPCEHRWSYNLHVAEQIDSEMRAAAATQATGPDTSRVVGGPQPLDGNAAADALAAEMHRRACRLRELREDPTVSASVRDHVYGEVLGLRGAIGIVLGHQVPGGSADLMGIDYYEAWCSRQGVTV